MKIVQLYNQTRSTFGGEYTVIANMTAILERNGHRVIHAVRSSAGIENNMSRKIGAAFNGIYSLSAASEVKRLIEAEQPDVIHAHCIYPQWSPSIFRACRQLGVPTVLHVHCQYLTCPNWYHQRNGEICELCFGGKEYWCLAANCRNSYMESAAYALRSYITRKMRLFLDNVDLFVTVSKFLKSRLVLSGFPEGQIEILYNSVPDIPSCDGDLIYGGEYIGYCGRLSSEKGVVVLIDAARRTGLPVRIAGDGPERSALERMAPSNVTFLGYLDRDSIGKFYRNCRFLILPSLTFEGFPMAAAEAMSYGKSVIGSRIGAIPEVIDEDRTGLLFDPNDSERLAQLMAALWADDSRVVKYGMAARAKVKAKCSEELYYARLLNIYRHVMPSSSKDEANN